MQAKREVDAAEAELKTIDTDGDGVVSKAEEFAAVDENKDGVISADEYDNRSEVVKDIAAKKSAVNAAKERAQGALKLYQKFIAEKVRFLCFGLRCYQRLPQGGTSGVTCAPSACMCMRGDALQVKILTTALQFISVFTNEDNYPVSTPPAYAKYVADASSWANVDFYSFFK